MTYDPKALKATTARLAENKQARSQEHDRRLSELYEKLPRLKEIERQLRHTMAQLMKVALQSGQDPAEAVSKIRDENLNLQSQRAMLLMTNGYSGDYLDEKPACALCGDTGYVSGQVCSCLKSLYIARQREVLSKKLDLSAQNFDAFRFDYYSDEINREYGISPKENMEMVYELCLDYARKFGKESANLFFNGGAGLGKTFLSACIAGEVLEKGYFVIYDTASAVFAVFESEKFGGSGQMEETVERYLNCDLLIIDDLGTEMTTQFVVSALYTLINTRLTGGKKTLISSNLGMDEIRRRYSLQIASRLDGEYILLPFFGSDIRQRKKQEW